MKIEYLTVDVFTAERFGGNPLAVVPDGRGLTPKLMQQVATEFNYSETTFVLLPDDPAHTARVRIFTPRAELPFAGHPNVGTAFVLAQQGEAFGCAVGGKLAFEEIAGLVQAELVKDGAQVVGARIQAPEAFQKGADVPAGLVAESCSLAAADVELANHAPCVATAGLPYVFAEISSQGALGNAVPRYDAFECHVPADMAAGICLYTHASEGDADIYARVFAPLHGVTEDPATGSANVALAGLLASIAPEPSLTFERTVAQGAHMGRPSRLHIAAKKQGGVVTETRVGGRCVPVMAGTLGVD